MTAENLEAIRRAGRAFRDGDLEAAFELFDPQAVYYEQEAPLDTAEVLRGLDQLRDSLMSYLEEFPDFHSEIDELMDVGDKVICVQRWKGTGRESGVSVELAEVIVYRFQNGKVIEARVYPDRTTAVEAAGL